MCSTGYPREERYRIHPDHARTLARYLADNLDVKRLGGACFDTSGETDADERGGAQYLSGYVSMEGGSPDPTARIVHLSGHAPGDNPPPVPDVSFSDRPLQDVAPSFSRNAVQRFPTPWDLYPWAPASHQGYTGNCSFDETTPACVELALDGERLMGAMAAMSATRMMLMSSLGVLKTTASSWPEAARLDDYVAHAEDILRVMDGSIGADGVALRPVVEEATGGTERVLVVPSAGGQFSWRADISFPATGDTFWDRSDGAVQELCKIVAGCDHTSCGWTGWVYRLLRSS